MIFRYLIAITFSWTIFLSNQTANAKQAVVGEVASAQTVSSSPSDSSVVAPWSNYFPYAPEKNEYNFELGGMWERDNSGWFGLTYGRHMGECASRFDTNCQRFLDVTAGVGHRDGSTNAAFLVGPRWQFVRFPQPFSPSFRVFGGVMNANDNDRNHSFGVYGASLAFTMSLHRKLNLKWESRIGGGEYFWAQTYISFALKIDDWVDQFGVSMKHFGQSTVKTTGTILKSTFEAPKTLIEWFNKPQSDSESGEPTSKTGDGAAE